MSIAVAFEHIFTCCNLGLCCYVIVAMLSIVLHPGILLYKLISLCVLNDFMMEI